MQASNTALLANAMGHLLLNTFVQSSNVHAEPADICCLPYGALQPAREA